MTDTTTTRRPTGRQREWMIAAVESDTLTANVDGLQSRTMFAMFDAGWLDLYTAAGEKIDAPRDGTRGTADTARLSMATYGEITEQGAVAVGKRVEWHAANDRMRAGRAILQNAADALGVDLDGTPHPFKTIDGVEGCAEGFFTPEMFCCGRPADDPLHVQTDDEQDAAPERAHVLVRVPSGGMFYVIEQSWADAVAQIARRTGVAAADLQQVRAGGVVDVDGHRFTVTRGPMGIRHAVKFSGGVECGNEQIGDARTLNRDDVNCPACVNKLTHGRLAVALVDLPAEDAPTDEQSDEDGAWCTATDDVHEAALAMHRERAARMSVVESGPIEVALANPTEAQLVEEALDLAADAPTVDGGPKLQRLIVLIDRLIAAAKMEGVNPGNDSIARKTGKARGAVVDYVGALLAAAFDANQYTAAISDEVDAQVAATGTPPAGWLPRPVDVIEPPSFDLGPIDDDIDDADVVHFIGGPVQGEACGSAGDTGSTVLEDVTCRPCKIASAEFIGAAIEQAVENTTRTAPLVESPTFTPDEVPPLTQVVFTFGAGHVDPSSGADLSNSYVIIEGDLATATADMWARYGDRWAFTYASEESAGVQQYGLQRVDPAPLLPEVVVSYDDNPAGDIRYYRGPNGTLLFRAEQGANGWTLHNTLSGISHSTTDLATLDDVDAHVALFLYRWNAGTLGLLTRVTVAAR